MKTAVQRRRTLTAIREDRANALPCLGDYLTTFAQQLAAFRLTPGPEQEPWDEAVVASIKSFTPYQNELVSLLADVVVHRPGQESASLIHRFLEQLVQYNFRPEQVNSWREWDFDNLRFIVQEIFLYCVSLLLKHERFEDANILLTSEYYCPCLSERGRSEMLVFTDFRQSMRSLEARKSRLKLDRLSLRGDMLKENCVDAPVTFTQLMQADFVLFLRSHCSPGGFGGWWPDTLVYVDHFLAERFELFARARSRKYFDRLKVVLGVPDLDQFKAVVAEFKTGERRAPSWDYESVHVAALSGVKDLGVRE